MQVKRVAASSGWRWVVEGFTVFSRSPGPLFATGMLVVLTLLVSSVPPIVGVVLPLLISPALGYGFAMAARKVLDGGRPSPLMLYQGLRPATPALLKAMLSIGMINAGATALALMVTIPIDGGQWLALLSGTSAPAADPAAVPGAVPDGEPGAASAYAALLFMALYSPIQLALWYAPLFAALHKAPPLRALFFSAVTVWRNKGAFAVYFIGWLMVAVGLSMLMRIVAGLLPAGLGTFVLAPGILLLLVALYGSFWATYRDTVDPVASDSTGSA
jgi:hypothetical protein